MILIILSIIMGYVGFITGGIFGSDIFAYLFGIIGVLSPALYTLDKIYKSTQNGNQIDFDVNSTLDTLRSTGILTNDEYEKLFCNNNLVDERNENRRKYDEGVKIIFDLSQRNIISEDEFNNKIRLLKMLYKQLEND